MTLLGFSPTPEQCAAWFAEHEAAFHQAARAKITRALLPLSANLHLTSRDIVRALGS